MCADTITAHFHWVKPEISGSPTTWGVKLNADLDLIDQTLFDTQTTANAAKALADNIVIGEIKMFAGVTPPANWKLCDGTVYLNSDIPLLAPVLNNQFGGVAGTSNAVPDLRSRFPIGYQAGGTLPVGTMGGEATHVLTNAELAAHTHTITDPGHVHDIVDNLAPGTVFGSYALTGSVNQLQDLDQNTQSATTGITINSTGGGAAHNNLPPYACVNFIIKFQ
jgi:microcystin-dependent protein